MDGNERIRFEEPGVARFLFASTAAAWIWLPVRLYLGYEWVHAGWEKVFGDPSWLSSTEPLKGFVGFALSQAGQGEHSPSTTDGTPRSCAGSAATAPTSCPRLSRSVSSRSGSR